MAKTVRYTLDKDYDIKMDMLHIEHFEELSGEIYVLILDRLDKLSTKTQIDLIWSFIHFENPDITRKEVVALIDEYSNFSELFAKVVDIYVASMPKKENVKKIPQDHKQPKNQKRA